PKRSLGTRPTSTKGHSCFNTSPRSQTPFGNALPRNSRFPSFPNSVWERASSKLLFRVLGPLAKQSFTNQRSQTEFGNQTKTEFGNEADEAESSFRLQHLGL